MKGIVYNGIKPGNKVLHLLIGVCFMFSGVQAKMLPRNFAVLNYTHVMFEYDQVPGATQYRVTIEEANARGATRAIIITNASLACAVTEGLRFGGEYKWKVDALQSGKIINTSPLNYFSIAPSQKIDTAFVRYHLETADKKAFNNDLLFIDHLGVLINRKCEPVWYIPEEKLPQSNDQFNFRAMRITRDGTFTFIYNARSMERDIDGEPLWDAPANTPISGAATETYHHDLQKLSDGSYLTCGYHFNSEPHLLNENLTCNVRYNTLLQFNNRGVLLWYWNEKDHVDKAVIFRNYTSVETEIPGTHLNGFDVNPKDSSIVMSFRNSSELLKIDMKNFGKVVYTWQGPASPKTAAKDINFISQHGPSVTPEGNIIIYNNNVVNEKGAEKVYNPKLLIVSNPAKNKPSQKLWEYEMAWSKRPEGVQGKEGYALQLPNKNLLVNTGGAERMFEVTPSKKIVWDCHYEKLDAASQTWKPFTNYRCGSVASLYPRYFTIENIYKGTVAEWGSVKINNEGAENDRYELEITDAQGNTLLQKKISVKKRSSVTVKWNDKKTQKAPAGGIKIKVWPEGSAYMARILNN